MLRRTRLLLTLALLGSLLAACGTGRVATLRDDAPEPVDVEVTISSQRLVLRALGQHPLAGDVDAELTDASEWLDRAEDLAAAREVDEARLALVLDAARAQLVMVKTWYDRKAADAAVGLPGRPVLGARGGRR